MASPSIISMQTQHKRDGLLHILSTSPVGQNEVLVSFADGSSAIYEAEELEKLRPTPKKIIPANASVRHTQFADVA